MEKKKNNFWSFNIGHAIIFVTWLITIGIYIGQQKALQAEQTKVNVDIVGKIDKLNTDLNIMDRNGSQLARLDSNKINGMENRLSRLEEYIPKIARLDARLEEMSSLLREVRDDIKELRKN